MKGGKWKYGVKEPGMPVEEEGIRRQGTYQVVMQIFSIRFMSYAELIFAETVCDMVLLTHHLVIASYLP